MIKPVQSFSCTIFSAKDKKGNVWFGNNEDAGFTFNIYINVFPKTKNTKFGYYTLSRGTPANGENFHIAGGMNESGLMYDFNATELYPVKNMYLKEEFPDGDKAILRYILANCETVEEVVAFFQKYWFQFGFRSAQMHLADRFGHFAIISPTGSRVLTNDDFQISTNYDICSNADSTTCWRYPIVQSILKTHQPSVEVFTDICKQTAQGRHTIYSSVSNLKTGDFVFYFSGDYTKSYQINIHTLLRKGRKSYLLGDLIPENPIVAVYSAYKTKGIEFAYKQYTQMELPADYKNMFLSNIIEYFISETNNYDIYPFLLEYVNTYNADYDLWLVKAAIEMQQCKAEQAKITIANCITTFPRQKDLTNIFVDRINSQFEKDANATFILEGYQDANFVITKSIPSSSTFYPFNNLTFMVKKDGKWVSRFKLPNGIYNYKFIVDGKEVLSTSVPIKVIENLSQETIECNQLCIGFSETVYPLNIELTVPNREDEVYIVGNQESICRSPIIFMKKSADYKRTIAVDVHYPAVFKFVTGGGQKEAIVRGVDKNQSILVDSTIAFNRYDIIGWR